MSFPKVGVIGAGQLARMMVPAAVDLGIELSFVLNLSICIMLYFQEMLPSQQHQL